MDTISRQAVIDAADKIIERDKSGNNDVVKAMIAWKVFVEGLPSVQPDIIHCKDCKHWREGTVFSYCDKLHGMGVLDVLDYMTAEDDYCSMAERRTDETD